MKSFSKEETLWLEKQYNTASQFVTQLAAVAEQAELNISELPESMLESDILYQLCFTIMILHDKVQDYELLSNTKQNKVLN